MIIQGTVWMGLFMAPGLPLVNVIKLILIMYIKVTFTIICIKDSFKIFCIKTTVKTYLKVRKQVFSRVYNQCHNIIVVSNPISTLVVGGLGDKRPT